MGNFFAELKRRHIYRVAAAYAVMAWVLLQLFNNLTPVMKLPDWAGTLVLVLIVGGFPVALIFAWILHLAKADAATQKTSAIDWILAGAAAVVIGIFVYQEFSTSGEAGAGEQTTVIAARSTAGSPSSAISIAVMPFANLSSDKDQEFFSDGMTDEIASALAKVPDLRVVARSSAFQFKGQNKEARAIGQALGATHLIEGSVRQAGNRVRITAELVRADDRTQIWSENYDRELTDIFAIQEDIARAITASLRMPLGLKPGENLVNNRGIDAESYQQYLRARGMLRAFDAYRARTILESIVALNPDYAPAWVQLAQVYSITRGADSGIRAGPLDEQRRRLRNANLDREEHAAREAVRLDPRYAGGYAALASVQMFRGKDWAGNEDLYHRALTLDPNDADSLINYSLFLITSGRLKQALGIAEQLSSLDPLVPLYNFMVAYLLQLNGENQRAIPMLEALSAGGVQGYFRDVTLATGYALDGRYSDAADIIASMPPESLVSRKSIDEAARLLRSAPAKVGDPNTLPALEGELRLVYPFVGAAERAFEYAERTLEIGAPTGTGMRSLWDPEFVSLRKTERFKMLVRDAGLVSYWRERGWPDLCHPTNSYDFECN